MRFKGSVLEVTLVRWTQAGTAHLLELANYSNVLDKNVFHEIRFHIICENYIAASCVQDHIMVVLQSL